jgi:hypothetical protein
MEVRLETYFTCSTHPADKGSIVFRAAGCGSVLGADCRSSEKRMTQNIHKVFSSEPAVTSRSVILYLLTSFSGYKLLP